VLDNSTTKINLGKGVSLFPFQTYHAVLGRPCYAKFMAVPNYTYLKLKMTGPNGVITVGSTYRHAYECDVECVEYAEALAESETLIADLECLSKEVPDAKRHAGNIEPAEAVKSVPLNPATTPASNSGSAPSLTPNRKQCSSTFSAQTPKFLRGVPRTCPAY
jgi:rhamnose utilization protein RhaD (predicted bifunctional aldolase and dehydrogenase)